MYLKQEVQLNDDVPSMLTFCTRRVNALLSWLMNISNMTHTCSMSDTPKPMTAADAPNDCKKGECQRVLEGLLPTGAMMKARASCKV